MGRQTGHHRQQLGLNSKYRTSREHPRKIYYADLDGNGTVDVIEGYYDEELKMEVPERDLRMVGGALPMVKEKFSSFEAYGKASLREIYGPKLAQLAVVSVTTLESMVFLNRGDHFEGARCRGRRNWPGVCGVRGRL